MRSPRFIVTQRLRRMIRPSLAMLSQLAGKGSRADFWRWLNLEGEKNALRPMIKYPIDIAPVLRIGPCIRNSICEVLSRKAEST